MENERRQEPDPVPGLSPAPAPTEVEQLRAQLAEAERERNQFKSLAQRIQADFANFRKRAEEEQGEFQRNANAQLLLKLLPALDDLERALGQLSEGSAGADAGWVEGMRLVARKFLAVLEELGVRRIEALQKPFDPWEHEIVGYQETTEHAEGLVLGLAREGYKLHGRVLRPALVTVAKSPQGQVSRGPSAEGKGEA
jgi:molecular chaperone GrpE